MSYRFQPEDREVLLDLFGKTHTIHLRLNDLAAKPALDTKAQEAIQDTAFEAHDLLVSLSEHLINLDPGF